jgi:hypothetical protein
MTDDTLKTLRLKLKGKGFGVFICLALLFIQTGEALLWRNDYPFTKWGMYHRLHPFEPYINFEVEIVGTDIAEENMFSEPWMLRERIWSLMDIGTPVDPFNKDINTYFNIVKKNSSLKQEEIGSVLRSFLFYPERFKNIKIEFLAWNKLTYKNTHQPDIKYTIFEGNH